MTVYVASARIDENGKAHGGKAGDQTGKEVSSQVWYDWSSEHPGETWVLLRCTDTGKRKKIADCMRAAYINAFIGYDQYQRDPLYDAVKDKGFDVNTLEKAVETDCSALVRVCVSFAGINCPNFRTTNQASVLVNTGFFKKLTASKYIHSPDYLKEGDILVSSKRGHTVVALNDGAKANEDAETNDLMRGDMDSAEVKAMQKDLIALGYSLGAYGADGDFGEATEKALKAFQHDHDLSETGVYDAKTREKVEALLTVPRIEPEESNALTVKGGTWNIRTGPGTGYPTAEVVKGGDKLTPIDIGSWQPILKNGQILYISKNAIKEFNS